MEVRLTRQMLLFWIHQTFVVGAGGEPALKSEGRRREEAGEERPDELFAVTFRADEPDVCF
jgi:hypothetical protein